MTMDTHENQDMIQEEEQQPVMPAAEPSCYVEHTETMPVKKKKGGKVFLACLLVAALVLAGCGATALVVNEYWEQRWEDDRERTAEMLEAMYDKIADLQEEIKDNSFTGNGNSVSGTPNTTPDGSLTPGQVYAQNVDAVVSISNQTASTSGSGFIISEDGYVVTNYHVVEGGGKLMVITHSGKIYPAALVGYVSSNDMAVLKIEATGLPYVKLGSSDDLIVGDQVVAIGNALGTLTNSLTVGYVSGVNRDISTGGAMMNMIQTDVAINSGNSGGPLFNMKGEVVGITTAKYSGLSGSGATIEGISFAIPIDDVIRKVTDLKEYGYLTGAYLGVTAYDAEGAYVVSVDPEYCAAKAGMRAEDVIVKVGKYAVANLNDLSRALEKYMPGDKVEVVVDRGGKQVTLEVTLDERPQVNNTDAPTQAPSQDPSDGKSAVPENGSLEDWWDYFFGD